MAIKSMKTGLAKILDSSKHKSSRATNTTRRNTTKNYKYATDELYIYCDAFLDEYYDTKPFRDCAVVNDDGTPYEEPTTLWGKFKEEFYWWCEFNVKDNYKKFIRSIKYFFQRRKRGWDDSDLWSLDYTVAKFMIPRLERFIDVTDTYPSDFYEHDNDNDDGFDKWKAIINEIIWYFKVITDEDDWSDRSSSIHLAIIHIKDDKDYYREITKEEKAKLPELEKAYKELQREYKRAEKYFGKYFTNLWW